MTLMRLSVVLLGLLVATPASPLAWGFDAHRFITEQAIALLPPELKPFYEGRKAFIVERSVDPDLWRTAGFERESPNHFLDMDYEEYGPYPFTALPRDFDRAVEKFGRVTVETQGLLPWRTQEIYGNLRRAFAGVKSPTPSTHVLDDVAFFSAILSHYVADGHVPLHAVVNYDGQLTEQHGVHARWESELFDRFRARLVLKPSPVAPIADPRDFMFDVLLASNRAAKGLLEADKKAAEGREFYDDAYFEAFVRETLPLVERRMSEAISAVASVIVGAWDEAGRPSMSVPPRGPRRIRPLK
jgi:hypothetical protein